MKKSILLLVLFFTGSIFCPAQNIGINSTGSAPNASVILDLNTGNNWALHPKGFLIPCLTTSQMDSISSPPTGSIIFDLTTNCLMIYTPVAGWQSYWCACNGAPPKPVISGPSIVCPSSTDSYSVTAIQGTTYYSWGVPSGATVTSGQGTNSVTITFGASAGDITCTALTSCGTSATDTLAVTTGTPSGTITFNYTGAVQTWTVPSCITTITVTAVGASGGHDYFYPSVPLPGIVDSGGEGGSCSGVLTVTGGSVLDIYVGGFGGYGYSTGGAGGFNGGGVGNSVPNGGTGYWASGGGGGASDIRVSPYALANRVVVAGGGGGAGAECNTFDDGQGGAGGGLTGAMGYYCGAQAGGEGGTGGSQTAGGVGYFGLGYQAGALGTGGEGYTTWPGGGGGGGYYGGGGGMRAGGGGGSSYVGAFSTVISNVQGTQWGNGYVIIQY